MRSNKWFPTFALIVTVELCNCAISQDSLSITEQQPDPRTKQELERDDLITIYRTELARLGLQPSTQDEPPRFYEKLDWGFSKMAVMEGSVRMSIDLKTGEIRVLRILARDKKYPYREDRRYKTALSLEDAEKVAKEHLNLINIHVEKYLPKPPDRLHVKKLRYHPDDNTWTVVYEKTYHSYPVDGYLEIEFLGDGMFLGFSSALEIVDCPTEVGITLDEAEVAARKAATTIAQLYGIKGEIGKECVLNPWSVPPIWSYQKGGALRIETTNPIIKGPMAYRLYEEKPSPTIYRLVYDFGFEIAYNGKTSNRISVFIDAETSECVGGHVF